MEVMQYIVLILLGLTSLGLAIKSVASFIVGAFGAISGEFDGRVLVMTAVMGLCFGAGSGLLIWLIFSLFGHWGL